MSYENAPSTILLATHCVACNRPLRDAVSVECGMGPDCRDKHGMVVGGGEGQSEANKLVHEAACAPRGERAPFIAKLAALGFPRLALAVAKGEGEVLEIAREGDAYTLTAPFQAGFGDKLRAARTGARWQPASKTWSIPATARGALWGVLLAAFPGAVLQTATGPVIIAK